MSKTLLAAIALAALSVSSTHAQSSTGFDSSSTGSNLASTASGTAAPVGTGGGINGGVIPGGVSGGSSSSSSSSGMYESIPEAGSTTGSNGESLTFCQKYTRAVFGTDTAANEQALITAVVARAVLGNQTDTDPAVPGILAQGSLTRPFFTGDVKYEDNPTNYVASYQQYGFNTTGDFGQLATKLVTYFGHGLGCTAAGFPGLAGTANMTAVHQGMNINWPTMQYFDQQIALSMLSYGVSQDDINNVAVPYLNQFNRYPSLHDQTIFPQGSYGAGQASGYPITEDEVCKDASCPVAPPAYSFCEKYTAALYGTVNATYEQDLVTAVVARAVLGGPNVQGIVGPNSPLLPFFNSSIQYRTNAPDYITSYSQHGLDSNYDFGKLATHLVEFFGTDILGCRAMGYPQYTGSDMRTVHANMPITIDDYNYFVQQVANSALSFGVSQQDVSFVGVALHNYYRGDNEDSVCNQPSCPCQPGLTANANGECTGTQTGPQPPPNNNGNGNGGNNNGNTGGKSNGAALLTPSIAGMMAAVVTAVVALFL